MKIRWLSILIALILIFSSIICSAEELAHLEKTNNGHPYNPTVSEQYRAEVYGYPHGEFLVDEENGNMVKDGQRGEYQYLGYNRYDHDFPNDKWFREQRHRGNIFDEDYNDVEWIENPAALESWKDINNNPELLEYMTTEEFFDTDHPTMGVKPTGKNIVQLLGENYQNIGIVISPPSKDASGHIKDHKDLVNAVINSFRYETDLMYINKDKEAVNIQNELLPKEGNNYGRRPASLTAQDPTGVDDIVLLEVFDRSTNGSRYSKTVEELYHSQSITGNTHRYLKEIMEGYWESGTGSSESEYKYREYIKDGQKIYKITERTRVTIRINPYNRNVYTHAHMPDGTRNYINDKRYMVKAWIGDIDLSGINNEYKKLGVLRGLYILDEIKVSVKGSLYDDVTW